MQTVGKEIGDLIVKLRNEKKITGKMLANSTRKSQSYISKLENGNIKKPRKETLVEILSAMELSDKEIERITDNYYKEGKPEIKKVGKKLYIKTEKGKNSESNNDFIQNSSAPADKETNENGTLEEKKDKEEILFKLQNQHDISAEMSSIAFHLNQIAMTLRNRTVLNTEHDYVRLGLHTILDRLELVKASYKIYVEKRIQEQ